MTSNHHAPYDQGSHVLQWGIQREATSAKASESLKAVLSSDWSLQLDPWRSESLVIADQHAAVNDGSGR